MYKSEQLAHNLKLLIENGSWQPHTKLPSLREQVQRSGFSLITVMNAYQELEAQGLIYSKKSQVILWLSKIIFRFHKPIQWCL
jgi:DNA-binding transcriptional MocR family regulator